MAKKIVYLYKEFGDNIFTRNSISDFFRRINNLREKEIVIDFRRIEFISRSCADEYLKQKKKSKKIIVERKVSNEVKPMFHLVENQLKDADFSFTPRNPANVLTCTA